MADPGRSRLETAKVATSAVFFLDGLAFATWASRIPSTRDSLGIGPGELGLLLLLGSAGSILGLPVAGRVAQRVGTARAVACGTGCALVGLVGAGVAVEVFRSVPLTAASLFLFCLGIGLWDMAMNLEGSIVERLLARTIMPRFHAGFSLGTVAGAAAGAGVTYLQIRQLAHFGGAALVIAGAMAVALRRFLPQPVVTGPPEVSSPAGPAGVVAPASHRFAWTERRTLLIGTFTLVAGFTEGAANDWLSVAFIDGYDLPSWAGVLGFAVFLVFMTLGRVLGTNLVDMYGRIPVLRVLLVLAGGGCLLVVFGTPPLAFAGAAIWGFGVSLGFPLGMSAAADEQEYAPARLSVVCTIAYGAFLVGPPLLGFLGDRFGVLRALVVVSLLLVVALLTLPALREPLSEPQRR